VKAQLLETVEVAIDFSYCNNKMGMLLVMNYLIEINFRENCCFNFDYYKIHNLIRFIGIVSSNITRIFS
jgi:hypothetical protein